MQSFAYEKEMDIFCLIEAKSSGKDSRMQIDGHHAMTYVAARCAGYTHQDSEIIAYCAQYVDDATNDGCIEFDVGAMYSRTASAHKMLDYRNLEELANHKVWVPFHFLPGNAGKPAESDHEGDSFVRKLVCYPNSFVARDMLKACYESAGKPYFLHRIGICMHVFADTWAHQGFAGVNHAINEVEELESNEPEEDQSLFGKLANFFLSEAFPLGHGAALSHPDKPYLKWRYKNGLGEIIDRDNPAIFLEAVDYMCRALRAFKNNDRDLDLENVSGLRDTDSAEVRRLILSCRGDGDTRHEQWLEAIAEGRFSFGPADLGYIPKGVGSWKHVAIGQEKEKDEKDEVFEYRPEFLISNWKCFHDALQAVRFSIVKDVLPQYGICAA